MSDPREPMEGTTKSEDPDAPMKSYGQYCAVAKALDVIGHRWSLLIVRELLVQGPCRYTDLQHGLPGIATNLLAARLRQLEAAGVVARETAAPPVAATLFSLTERGRELRPVVMALGDWGAHDIERSMTEAAQGAVSADADVFRAHWLGYPVSLFCPDRGPRVVVEVRTQGQRAVIRRVDDTVTVSVAPAAGAADLVVEGPPPLILGVLSGRVPVSSATARGAVVGGDVSALDRLRGAAKGPPSRR